MLNRSVEQSQRENFAINMRAHSYEKYLEMKGYDYDEELLAEKNSTFGKVNRCIDVVISCVRFDFRFSLFGSTLPNDIKIYNVSPIPSSSIFSPLLPCRRAAST